ncbi:MAG: pectate lyase [Bacteroidales bacterium]|jgi:pectate lyase|nr:pectate lyase [Bacteroidales bacterium]
MKKTTLIVCAFIVGFVFPSQAQTPAFPGAEGGGKYVAGGRGGEVYYVNTLEDTEEGDAKQKEGSLRWCLSQEGRKTVLFNVAGIIRLKSVLRVFSNTTIAGQSAPGDGICIADNSVRIQGDNVIIRFVRFRMGDLQGVQDDALSASRHKGIIIDHCSMSWSTDECASFYNNENFTLQWCILSESLRGSTHKKGNHGYGGIWGGYKASFHHNLLASHDSRNPRMCGSRYSNRPDLELVDFRNNIIYNWGINSGYAGEGGSYNFINNYYKPGAATASTVRNRIFSPNADDGTNKQPSGVWGTFYLNGNYMDGSADVTGDNRLGLQPRGDKDKKELIASAPFDVPPIATDDAQTAYEKVLNGAGASFRRDKTDERVICEVREGLAPVRASADKKTKAGHVDSQNDVGGWDNYTFDKPIADSDRDGIPDGWLNANYPLKKATDKNDEGYTYLEVYLNSLVENIIH